MPKNPFELPDLDKVMLGEKGKPAKKRVQFTPAQRLHIWESPKVYGRTCSICHEKITKMSDLELDHTKPYAKGGKKQALAHRECNRLKASGSLRKIQKAMGFKTTRRKKRSKTKSKKKKKPSPFEFPKIDSSKGYL